MKSFVSGLIAVVIALAGCGSSGEESAYRASNSEAKSVAKLKTQRDAIVRFFEPMKINEGDWLYTRKEPGETFEEYVSSSPTRPTKERNTIYIQPIGTFTREQAAAIEKTANYMRAYYSLPVTLNKTRPIGDVPFEKKRLVKYRNNLQIRTGYFLDDVLPQLLPDDAAALIAFTNYDLFPEPTWAFVFGQASLDKRVGVWSLYQFADPKTGKYDARLLLDRTLKIAMHETGHMFSMKHCTKYECLMSGTNHLAETDRRPLDNCPDCMAKLAWAMKYEPEMRYRQLAAFWRKNGRPNEAKVMEDKAAAVANVK